MANTTDLPTIKSTIFGKFVMLPNPTATGGGRLDEVQAKDDPRWAFGTHFVEHEEKALFNSFDSSLAWLKEQGVAGVVGTSTSTSTL